MQVSGFALMTAADAKKLARYWLKYTEDVRNDDQVQRSFCALSFPGNNSDLIDESCLNLGCMLTLRCSGLGNGSKVEPTLMGKVMWP